jgi:response regulator RpfG family c-di-GMP phosphodiesterase
MTAIANEVPPDIVVVDAHSPIAQIVAAIRSLRSCEFVPVLLLDLPMEDQELVADLARTDVTDVLPVLNNESLLHARLGIFVELAQLRRLLNSMTNLISRQVLSVVGPTHDREAETLRRFAATIENHKYVKGAAPASKVVSYVRIIAESLRMPEVDMVVLELSAPLHDIGLIAVSDAILQKPGKLSRPERTAVFDHPQIGFELLQNAQSKYLKMAGEIALHHHARYDGGGYPHGFAAENIS